MGQPPAIQHDTFTDRDHHVVLFPTRHAPASEPRSRCLRVQGAQKLARRVAAPRQSESRWTLSRRRFVARSPSARPEGVARFAAQRRSDLPIVSECLVRSEPFRGEAIDPRCSVTDSGGFSGMAGLLRQQVWSESGR